MFQLLIGPKKLRTTSVVTGEHFQVPWATRSIKAATLDPMALLTDPLDALRTYAGSFAWQPMVRFSRSIILGLLRRILVGQILVRDSDGAVTVCGAPQVKDGTPRTDLRVLKETFWVRVLLFADMVSSFNQHPNLKGCCGDISAPNKASRVLVLMRWVPRALLKASCWANSLVRI